MSVTPWATATTAVGAAWTPDSGTLVSAIRLNDSVWVSRPAGSTGQLVLGGFETSPGTPLALPATAIPEGLEVESRGHYWDGALLGGQTAYNGIRTSKDGVTPLYNTKEFEVGPLPEGTYPAPLYTLGGPTDLWGGIWSDVEMEGLYLFLTHGPSSTDSGIGRMFDHVRLRVYYSLPSVTLPGIIDAGNRYIPGFALKGSPGALRRG